MRCRTDLSERTLNVAQRCSPPFFRALLRYTPAVGDHSTDPFDAAELLTNALHLYELEGPEGVRRLLEAWVLLVKLGFVYRGGDSEYEREYERTWDLALSSAFSQHMDQLLGEIANRREFRTAMLYVYDHSLGREWEDIFTVFGPHRTPNKEALLSRFWEAAVAHVWANRWVDEWTNEEVDFAGDLESTEPAALVALFLGDRVEMSPQHERLLLQMMPPAGSVLSPLGRFHQRYVSTLLGRELDELDADDQVLALLQYPYFAQLAATDEDAAAAFSPHEE